MSPVTDPGYAAEKQKRYRERRRVLDDLEAGEVQDAAVTSFVRAAIRVGLGALDPRARTAEMWSDDYVANLILRSAQTPTAIGNTPALSAVTAALLDALVPASAAVDLLRRGVQLNFAGAASITVAMKP